MAGRSFLTLSQDAERFEASSAVSQIWSSPVNVSAIVIASGQRLDVLSRAFAYCPSCLMDFNMETPATIHSIATKSLPMAMNIGIQLWSRTAAVT